MRALRTLIGLILALASMPALFIGVAGWSLMQHGDRDGAFSARIGPVRSDGYAIVVEDVAGLVERHGIAGLLGSDRVRVTVNSASVPLTLWIVPAVELGRYLDGVPRTELTGVGYADGTQPVQLADYSGTNLPGPRARQPFWATAPSGQSLEWDRATDTGAALLLVRADGRPAFDAVLAVTLYPGWLATTTWTALLGGALLAFVGFLLVFWPGQRRELVFVVQSDRMLELADRIADRLAVAGPPRTHDYTDTAT